MAPKSHKREHRIRLPGSILDEIRDRDGQNDDSRPQKKRKLKNEVSRKEKRKQERQAKKMKKTPKEAHVSLAQKNGLKSVKPSGKSNKPSGKSVTFADQLSSDSEESHEDFGDNDISLDEASQDDLSDDHLETEDMDDGNSVEDTWAKLRALKEKKAQGSAKPGKAANAAKEAKSSKIVKSTESDVVTAKQAMDQAYDDAPNHGIETRSDSTMTVNDTWAALMALKNKKEAKVPKEESNRISKVEISKVKELKHDQDDEDINYYKKKLGLGKGKKLSKEDDGLDDLLDGLEGFDSESMDEDNESDSEHDGESDDGNEDKDEDTVLNQPRKRENPYAPASQVTVKDSAVGASKYIPPSKRLAQSETPDITVLKRKIKGLFNRLSEDNIGSILNELEKLYLSNPRHSMNSTISNIIIESTAIDGTLLETFLMIQATIATALYRSVGVEFGASFVQTLVEEFQSFSSRESTSGTSNKQALNLLSLLAELYTFQLIACNLIYDFIKRFLADINQQTTENLLKIVRNCGSQLRTDDPAALKEIIGLVQVSVSKMDEDKMNSRTKFLIETLTALKNNRQKHSLDSNSNHATRIRMKKFLGGVVGKVSEPLRVSLDDIENIDTKGKWWLVGAAWKNKEENEMNTLHVEPNTFDDMLQDSSIDWLAVARSQRMNTDIRRAIFIAIMTSEDYVDAYERIKHLNLKNKQEREVSRVILKCCSTEDVYNPFYGLLATRLCAQHSIKKSFQFALWDYLGGEEEEQEEDEERPSSTSSTHKTMQYARLYGMLVSEGVMGLDIVKNVDFLTAPPQIQIFLELFFITFFDRIARRKAQNKPQQLKTGFGNALFDNQDNSGEKRDEKALIQIIARVKDPVVLKGVQYFLKNKVQRSDLIDNKQKERVKWGIETTEAVIKEILRS